MTDMNFEKVVENIVEPVVIVDDSKILFKNKSFEDIVCKTIDLNYFLSLLSADGTSLKINNLDFCVKKLVDRNCIYYILKKNENDMEDIYSDFISTISHELRTPLTSIRGFADTMLMSFERLDETQLKRFLSIIKEQSNRLIKLVENLLSISKMQVQNSKFVYKSVSVKPQIDQTVCILKNQYKTINFDVKIDKNTSSILVDENKFQQIILNLIENAAKYSYENGTVEVSVENSKDKDYENFVSIKIKDYGVGIPTEHLSKIFEKFARIENHLTRKTEGSGLGLYIVKSLIDKMQGFIMVESSTALPNSGTTFNVLFPAVNYSTPMKKIMESK